MDHSSQTSPLFKADRSRPDAPGQGAVLSIVSARLPLGHPAEPAPQAWQDALAALLEWTGVEAEFVPAQPARRLPRMADWGLAPQAAAPVFAPWIGWSPSAFQHGGLPGLPQAQFVASYLIDHARGAAPAQSGIDLVLMSPHPSVCVAEDAGSPPLPRLPVLKAMIRAARAEGRERLAIIVHARQRGGIARQLLAADRDLTRDGVRLDILAIEDALPALLAGRAGWDAIIAMPDLRSIVFAVLAQTSGVRGAWPMLWYGRGLQMVTCEAAGEGMARLSLDAPALIHALALALREAGAGRAAWRLHDAWARLRDSGVTSAGRGDDAPYVTVVKDSDFIAMLQRDAAVSKRAQQPWRAIKNAKSANPGSQSPVLRIVSSS